jgi:hypothetical protein
MLRVYSVTRSQFYSGLENSALSDDQQKRTKKDAVANMIRTIHLDAALQVWDDVLAPLAASSAPPAPALTPPRRARPPPEHRRECVSLNSSPKRW